MDFYSHNISYDVYIATVQTCVRVGLSVYVPIAIVIISICMYKVVHEMLVECLSTGCYNPVNKVVTTL